MNLVSPHEDFSALWMTAALSMADSNACSIVTYFIPRKLFLCCIIHNHINYLIHYIL